MSRRMVLAALAAAGLVRPWKAAAQQKLPRLGILYGGVQNAQNHDGLLQALAELGWIPNRTILIEEREADGDAKRARSYAQELVSWSPSVLLAASSIATEALHRATGTIPILFSNVSDPVGSGFVKSLAKPGGNISGFANFEYAMGEKWLDLLKQIAPGTLRVAVIYNQDNPGGRGHLASVQKAAPAFGLGVAPISARSGDELAALAGIRDQGDAAILVTPSAWGLAGPKAIELSMNYRLPAIFPHRDSIAAGGMLYYGTDRNEPVRGAAHYVDRILKGARVGDLPVQAPTKYELVINIGAARKLGLTVPQSLLARADEVIE